MNPNGNRCTVLLLRGIVITNPPPASTYGTNPSAFVNSIASPPYHRHILPQGRCLNITR